MMQLFFFFIFFFYYLSAVAAFFNGGACNQTFIWLLCTVDVLGLHITAHCQMY